MFKSQKIYKEVPATEEMHHEAVVVAIDVGGRIGLELDGHVRCRGVELVPGECTTVLAQDVGREVIAIVQRQYVVLSKMKAVREHGIHDNIILSQNNSVKHAARFRWVTLHFLWCL